MCRHDLFDTDVLEFPMKSVTTIKASCKKLYVGDHCSWEPDQEVNREANTSLTDKMCLFHTYTCNHFAVASYKEVK